MESTKIMTVVGTRPEIIRLSRVISRLDAAIDHVLVHTGQNYDYELNKIFFDDLNLKSPDLYLEAARESAAATIGTIIEKMDRCLGQIKPDALLVLGDTNSCLAAFSAKRRKIPVFHMEAGNRCFDQRVPEEINRKIVDHISDINLPYSSIAREYLLREGIAPDRIIKTGSPLYEVIHHYLPLINESNALKNLDLIPENYFLVSSHREENIESDDNFFKLADTLNSLAERYNQPIIVSTHPRTLKRIESTGVKLAPAIRILKPMKFSDYVHLQIHARLVVSDSGSISEESSILNFPALNIREAHERPEGMEEGAVIMCGLKSSKVLEAAEIAQQQSRGEQRTIRLVDDYSRSNVSEKVLRIILSYIDYINTNVWKK